MLEGATGTTMARSLASLPSPAQGSLSHCCEQDAHTTKSLSAASSDTGAITFASFLLKVDEMLRMRSCFIASYEGALRQKRDHSCTGIGYYVIKSDTENRR